jgi:hypothetical protein
MAESSMLRPVTSTRAFCIPCRGPTKSGRMKSSGRFCRSLPISTSGELLAKIKSLPKPLAGYVFSRDQQAIDRVLQSLSFGGGAVNQTNIFLVYRIYALRGSGNVRNRELLWEIRL